MERDNTLTFHCTRKNMNDALMRVPLGSLTSPVHQQCRYEIMGHEHGTDVNKQHYSSVTMQERAALVTGVSYDIGDIVPFDIESGVEKVRVALKNKNGDRRDREDMGPLNDELYCTGKT